MSIDLHAFSLLFPEQSEICFSLSDSTANDLSVDFLCAHLAASPSEQPILKKFLLQMPVDAKIIAYRRAIYQDLKQYPDLCEELLEIFDSMRFYTSDEGSLNYRKASIWELIGRLKKLENYSTSVTRIQHLLENIKFSSQGMQELSAFIDQIYHASGFDEFLEDIHSLSEDISAVRSMTLGVNFRDDFRPDQVGIISLNDYYFQEEGILKKFFHFHRKKHPNDKDLVSFTMLTHAGSGTASESLLMKNLTNLVEEMLPGTVSKLRRVLKRYTDESGMAVTRLADEFLFYLRFIQIEQKLKDSGYPCYLPDFSDQDTQLSDFYNLKLALCCLDGTVTNPLVSNPIEFTKEHTVLILTGPNRGGKTILTQGIGLAFLLFQQGVFVPCSGGKIRLCDGIYTHFPADENQTVSLGRLGEEAERFSQICETATSESLLLFNESFSTTSHSESLYIAEDVIKYLCYLGARTCFNTHMHELAAHAETFSGKGGAVSLVMGKRESDHAYQIRFEKPDGKSYAHDIACQYGITFEQLRQKQHSEEKKSSPV